MADDKFTQAAGAYTAATRQRDATSSINPTAQAQAEKTKRDVLDNLAKCCHPDGLHLLAVDKVYSTGADFRWGSPVAERVAAEVSRESHLHPFVGSLSTNAENIALAIKTISYAIGQAATRHPANQSSGWALREIWLDSTR
jgi:hypothetical protein